MVPDKQYIIEKKRKKNKPFLVLLFSFISMYIYLRAFFLLWLTGFSKRREVGHPVTTNAISIYPHHSFSHASHSNSNRVSPSWSIKTCLVNKNVNSISSLLKKMQNKYLDLIMNYQWVFLSPLCFKFTLNHVRARASPFASLQVSFFDPSSV